jgi:hypothetical protein
VPVNSVVLFSIGGVNFDTRRNDELERGGIATDLFRHVLDAIEHRSDGAQRVTDLQSFTIGQGGYFLREPALLKFRLHRLQTLRVDSLQLDRNRIYSRTSQLCHSRVLLLAAQRIRLVTDSRVLQYKFHDQRLCEPVTRFIEMVVFIAIKLFAPAGSK